jgi:hypothetical protein
MAHFFYDACLMKKRLNECRFPRMLVAYERDVSNIGIANLAHDEPPPLNKYEILPVFPFLPLFQNLSSLN